jgi:hypothetical protein
VDGFGEKVSGSLSNNCRLFRKVARSSSQLVPQSKATDYASLQSIYKLSHSWVTVTTAITMNFAKCILKEILIQISGAKPCKTGIVHCPPHKLDSSQLQLGTHSVMKEDEERQVYKP